MRLCVWHGLVAAAVMLMITGIGCSMTYQPAVPVDQPHDEVVVPGAQPEEPSPVGEESSPVGEEPSPVGEEPPPVGEEPSPVGEEPPPETPADIDPKRPTHQGEVVAGRLGSEAVSAEVMSAVILRFEILSSPLPGAAVPSPASHLPGSPRTYRNGIHQGVDFYDGYVSIPIVYGDAVQSAGSGLVARADTDYQPLDPDLRRDMLARAAAERDTPPDILDHLHGQQVWIDHGGGVLTRYSHLAGVQCEAGDRVDAGTVIGLIGNSGTSDEQAGGRGGAHLHFEIYLDGRAFWDGLTLDQIRLLLGEVLSRP